MNQETLISVYTRNRFDPEQVEPETSSTLVTPNLVGYLQCRKEGQLNVVSDNGNISHCNIFGDGDVDALIGEFIIEHHYFEISSLLD